MALLLAVVMLAGCAPSAPRARAEDGIIDLRGWDPARDGPARLDGRWRFAWGELDEALPAEGGDTIPVPSAWDGHPEPDGPLPARGVATYGLRVLLDPGVETLSVRAGGASSAWRLLVDGREVCGSGVVSADLSQVRPSLWNRVCLVDAHGEVLDLVVQVANAEHRRGGLRRAWSIGDPERVAHTVLTEATRDLSLALLILVVGIYQLLFYLVRKQERSRLWFGMGCLVVCARVFFGSSSDVIHIVAPWLPWGPQLRLEYLSVSALSVMGVRFIGHLFSEVPLRRAARAAGYLNGALALWFVLAPRPTFLVGLFPALAMSLVTLALLVVQVAYAAHRGLPLARSTLLSMLVLLVGLVLDASTTFSSASLSAGFFPYAAVGLVGIETYGITRDFARSYATIERLGADLTVANRDLREMNEAAQRFVPVEFLELLGRRSIRGVVPGEHVATRLSVLFCDIRAFTPLVESLTPGGAFRFINAWHARMEPAIRRHHGFINSYMGDGIMALFHGGADAAVRAAVDMLRALDAFNQEHEGEPGVPLSVGIGINAGPIMLGTIGGAERLDTGVVGDAVNLASRVEGMTKLYGARLIVSEAVRESMAEPEAIPMRELDLVVAKGKRLPIRIYEVLDGLPEQERAAKLSGREDYAGALAAWREGRWEEALAGFRACLARWPGDVAAALMARRCEEMSGTEAPDGWTGASVLDRK